MKPKFASLIPAFSPMARCSALACISLSATHLHAGSAAWLAAPVSADWADAQNWAVGGPPGATTGTTNTDTATFGTSTGLAVTVDAGRNLQNISFTANLGYALSGSPLNLTSGGTILSNGNSGEPRITAALLLQGDGGTYKIQTDMPGTNREMIISVGGITGVSTSPNNTALTLAGASGGVNAITGIIGNGAGGGTLSLVKEGTGLWVLSAINTFSGGITATGGILRVERSGNSTDALGAGPATINGGTLRFQSTASATVNTPIVATTNGGFVAFRGNGFFNPPSISGDATTNLSLVADTGITITSSNFQNYLGTLNLGNGTSNNIIRLASGYNEASLTSTAINLKAFATFGHQSGTNGTTTVTHIGTLSGEAGSALGFSGAGSGTFNFSIGSRNEDSIFAGNVVNGGTKTALIKVGNNKLTLSGENSYTGSTTVNGGILSINRDYLDNNAAVTIATGAVMDLNFVGTDFVGSLRLGGTLVPDGTYNSGTPVYGGFFTGTGSLRVGATAYSAWAATNVASQSPSLDFDKDGVSNGIEYFYGTATAGFTANPAIINGKITWPKDPLFSGTYTVQTSPDLVNWTDVGSTVVGDTVEYSVPAGETKFFVRLDVVPN